MSDFVVKSAAVEAAEYLFEWVDSRETHQNWTANSLEYPLSLQRLQRHVQAVEVSSSPFLVLDSDGVPVAYFELGGHDARNASAHLERVIIRPRSRGKGLACGIVVAAAELFFAGSEAHRLELVVATDNVPAIRAYERVGFVHEGTLRESRRYDDNWRSVHVMGLLRGELRG